MGWWLRMTGSPMHLKSTQQLILEWNGPLDPGALSGSLTDIIARHAALRTGSHAHEFGDLQVSSRTARLVAQHLVRGRTFESVGHDLLADPDSELLGAGVFRNIIHDPQAPKLELHCMEDETSVTTAAKFEALASTHRQIPLDYRCPPLIRSALVRTGRTRHVLILTVDYLVSDGWSLDILQKELIGGYRDRMLLRASPTRPLQLQFDDYAVWERSRLRGTRLEGLLKYWNGQWSAVAKQRTCIAPDGCHASGTAPECPTESLRLDEELIHGIRSFCRTRRITLYCIFLSAFAMVLRRYSPIDSIPVLCTAPNRIAPGSHHIIGRFSNQHVIVLNTPAAARIEDQIERTACALPGFYDHQELPFFAARIWNKLPSATVNASFRMKRIESRPASLGELTVRELSSPPGVTAGLDLQIIDGGFFVTITASANSLFAETTPREIVEGVASLLKRVAGPLACAPGAAAC